MEQSWPKHLFGKANYSDLSSNEKRDLNSLMEKKAVFLYNKYVDKNRLERRRRAHTNRALAEYYEERYLFNMFNRIRKLGDADSNKSTIASDSDCSLETVINIEEFRSNEAENQSVDSSNELDMVSRIVYEHSSEDEAEYLTANEEELCQNSDQIDEVVPSTAQIDKSTRKRSKLSDADAPIATETISPERQLRSRLIDLEIEPVLSVDNSRESFGRNVTLRKPHRRKISEPFDRNVTVRKTRMDPVKTRSKTIPKTHDSTSRTTRLSAMKTNARVGTKKKTIVGQNVQEIINVQPRRSPRGKTAEGIMKLRSGATISPSKRTRQSHTILERRYHTTTRYSSLRTTEISSSLQVFDRSNDDDNDSLLISSSCISSSQFVHINSHNVV